MTARVSELVAQAVGQPQKPGRCFYGWLIVVVCVFCKIFKVQGQNNVMSYTVPHLLEDFKLSRRAGRVVLRSHHHGWHGSAHAWPGIGSLGGAALHPALAVGHLCHLGMLCSLAVSGGQTATAHGGL